MMLSRRQLLVAVASAAAGLSQASHKWRTLDDRILTDTHVHIPFAEASADILIAIKGKAVGFTSNGQAMTYDQAIKLLGQKRGISIDERTPRLLAAIYENGTFHSYIFRAQETTVVTGKGTEHHMVAIGCPANLPDYRQPNEAAARIADYGGISQLAHSYVIWKRGTVDYRLPTPAEEDELFRICTSDSGPDAMETFNSQGINDIQFTEGLFELLGLEGMADWARLSSFNTRAKKLQAMANASISGKKVLGIATSDAHYLHDVGKAGIYLPASAFGSFDSMKKAALSGDFWARERYADGATVMDYFAKQFIAFGMKK